MTLTNIMVKAYATANVILPLRDNSKGTVISGILVPQKQRKRDNGGFVKCSLWIRRRKQRNELKA